VVYAITKASVLTMNRLPAKDIDIEVSAMILITFPLFLMNIAHGNVGMTSRIFV
jgi:hypothetical protein